ncbi:sulfite oxidase [Planomonospora sp. ID67723]|uniref:sulfite oxidase n=1 Tax=Planomonospora sp. ID67723 TaxID=2738134 RepID=UPI0018C41A6A|nr:sulfite oxidase [Planomonospora sp. ID67723]MBG0831083.1 sulfite oxidase [Planomonospora sp. ID67723]
MPYGTLICRTATGIVKPLPPELFTVHGGCAEMRWEAMRGAGYHVPADRFFVRNHTSTPIIDAAAWRLELHGSGLGNPRSFGYEDLLALPAVTRDVMIECAGNGRSLFADQQHQRVSGTPWRLGAVGVARWRGVPLSTVLDLAGILPSAVDVMPRGLDPRYVSDGVDHGRVRRPVPVAKALDDVILAYEMNGRPLPPDHGYPVRLVVPSWIGLASIKWVGDIEVSASPLASPWTTAFYRMFGEDHPPEGGPVLTTGGIRSAFELPWGARLAAGRPHVLHGRSWSAGGRITRVEVSVDAGATWHRAELRGSHVCPAWTRWHLSWNPRTTGPHVLMARAADETGTVQPTRTPYNELGYLFDAVVRHPVTVIHF